MINVKTIILVVGVAVVVVGVGLLSTQTWNPAWNPFGKPPAKTVETSIENLFDLESLRAEGGLSADVSVITTDKEQQQFKVSFDFTEDIDASNRDNIKGEGDLALSFTTEGTEFKIAALAKMFGRDLYVKLTTLPPFIPLPIDVSLLKDQWVKIETTKLKEMTGGGFDVPSADETKTKEILEGLADLFEGEKMFDVEKRLGTEDLQGQETQHYLVSVDKEALKKLIPEYLQFMRQYIAAEKQAEYDQNVKELISTLPQEIDDTWKEIGGVEFEVWIGEGILRKLRYQRELDLTTVEQLKDKVESGTVDFAFEVQFSNFNKHLEIAEPTSFRTLEEMISVLMPSILPPSSGMETVPQE